MTNGSQRGFSDNREIVGVATHALSRLASVAAVSVLTALTFNAAFAGDQAALLARGSYLVNTVAACGNCHTPRVPDATPTPGMFLAGGNRFVSAWLASAKNITPDKDTGLGSWTDQQIIVAMREGKTKEGSILGPPMPVDYYNKMSDGDAKAIVAYLRSVPSIRNEVPESKHRIPPHANRLPKDFLRRPRVTRSRMASTSPPWRIASSATRPRPGPERDYEKSSRPAVSASISWGGLRSRATSHRIQRRASAPGPTKRSSARSARDLTGMAGSSFRRCPTITSRIWPPKTSTRSSPMSGPFPDQKSDRAQSALAAIPSKEGGLTHADTAPIHRGRRDAGSGGSLAAAAERPRYTTKLAPPADAGLGKTVRVQLTAAERLTALSCFGGRSLPMWTFTEGAWPPVVRLNFGDELQATLENRLPRPDESTSIHWHGIRLPNDQDGVPHLVQPPVNVGETFHYRFTPPDCGTYFFHTHCNTVEQLGRGLQGTLIIDGDAVDRYDADVVLLMRDWVIDPDTGGSIRSSLCAGGPCRDLRLAPHRQRRGQSGNPASGCRRLPSATDQFRSDAHHENRRQRGRSCDHRH